MEKCISKKGLSLISRGERLGEAKNHSHSKLDLEFRKKMNNKKISLSF